MALSLGNSLGDSLHFKDCWWAGLLSALWYQQQRIYFHDVSLKIAWENSRHFGTPPLVSPRNDVWETSAKIPYWWDITTQIWVVLQFWLAEANFPRGTTDQKHYPDLCSDTSSEWNFCARFSDVIWRGNKWRRRKTSAVFSGWFEIAQFCMRIKWNESGWSKMVSCLKQGSKINEFCFKHSQGLKSSLAQLYPNVPWMPPPPHPQDCSIMIISCPLF